MIIKSQRLKEAILAALADKEMVKILDCVMYNPKPVNDIIKENNIPHTRHIERSNGLLKKDCL